MPPKVSRFLKNIAVECAQVSVKLDQFGLTVFFAMRERCRQTPPKNNMPKKYGPAFIDSATESVEPKYLPILLSV